MLASSHNIKITTKLQNNHHWELPCGLAEQKSYYCGHTEDATSRLVGGTEKQNRLVLQLHGAVEN